ncbi:xanthine dehydrogenase accessory protein XdhC [Acidocella aminolytica]|uniref:Xanthine dehydrogenase accessory factor XdhC/CoxI n=1 Tax=Acidocella aminolytica 101 = DSM 11237 TaxID=1120923 RepID=A0A0D6PBW9_9PROT|nr:xanthine dehydrogenase accessory protein XdhC [Acidocella aminolytica]GAN79147.1 xanthine dehydrogenase accessory factor XdhC/CoxI [Acidocella aminolytica 101 = DSM 11237]GBQ43688.1 xanthine and CO dehydrogenase maturation factor XdhC/CoxF [Acidocella aminolytica 101 = DSM 11237]SHE66608.1 xanthine dehydrogenase accessory factor [Acidocella aminolytica 101 = DSM 11237]
MAEWLAALRALLPHGPVALVSVLATEGSAPRGAGTKMLVTAKTVQGTIGGGNLEFTAISQARAALAQAPGSWAVQDYPLGPLLGQCCGGRVRLLVEHLSPAACGFLDVAPGETLVSELTMGAVHRTYGGRLAASILPARGEKPGVGTQIIEPLSAPSRPVLLFGAGHVGQAIARACAGLPLSLGWFDTRPDLQVLPGLVCCSAEAMEDVLASASSAAAVLILTHDHALDYRLATAALRGPAGFVGMIGSVTKRARFLARLHGENIDASRFVCPIGLPGVGGKQPAVIAIAVAAQLLSLPKESHDPA